MQGNVCQQGRNDSTLRRSTLRCMEDLLLDISCFEPLFDEFLSGNWTNGLEQILVRDLIECRHNVGVHYPLLSLVGSSQEVDFFERIMAASARSEPITTSLELRFPSRFQGVFDHCLKAPIHDDRHPQSPLPHHATEFRDG